MNLIPQYATPSRTVQDVRADIDNVQKQLNDFSHFGKCFCPSLSRATQGATLEGYKRLNKKLKELEEELVRLFSQEQGMMLV